MTAPKHTPTPGTYYAASDALVCYTQPSGQRIKVATIIDADSTIVAAQLNRSLSHAALVAALRELIPIASAYATATDDHRSAESAVIARAALALAGEE
jgi:hypothetical protein